MPENKQSRPSRRRGRTSSAGEAAAPAAETALEQPARRKLVRAVDVALGLCWTVAAFCVLVGSLPQSALATTYKMRQLTIALVPEGYGFFTRSPLEARLTIYRMDGKTLTPASQADYRGMFLAGISRKSTIRGIEIGRAVGKIGADAWVECRGPIEECAAKIDKPPVQLDLGMRVRTLCGRYLMREQKPVPWAWAGSSRPIHMPSRFAIVSFVCPAERAS